MHKIFQSILVAGFIISGTSLAHANNLNISNVVLGARDPGTKTLVVKFNINWENSWRNKINHDAVWLTVRLNNPAAAIPYKRLCQVSTSGINPTGFATENNSLEFYVPADKKGTFIRRTTNSSIGNVSATGAQITINYESCGFSDADEAYASIFGLEMVFVPQGSFYAGDNNTSTASFNKGTSDSKPWNIGSEGPIAVTNAVSNSYHYVSNSNTGEYSTGATFTVPAAYPKGFAAFYIMRYEITEGQWVEFLNSLPTAEARANHDLTDTSHKNADTTAFRNTISCTSTPLSCSTQRPTRAVSFLSWSDLAAFLDWAALRPMTELEFEKTARGPIPPVAGEFVWGSTDITAADAISGSEDGSETITTTGANAHYNNTTLGGGDATSGAEYQSGALRGGIFAKTDTTRVAAGASYYGVMDLGGNLSERVVTVGNAAGLSFTGTNGDGYLATATGFEGNADVLGWPGYEPDHGVTGAAGAGFRGGSWMDSSNALRISDRAQAALTLSTATSTFGGRGVRTYDGN